MNKLNYAAVLIFVLLTHQATSAADLLTAKPFVRVKASTEMLKNLCHDLKQTCSESGIELWQLKDGQHQTYYLIDRVPQLIELQKVDGKYKVMNQWNFKSYSHQSSELEDDELVNMGLSIYPALYPLNKNQNAVAIINTWSTTYSGGGRSKEIADFVLLEANRKFKPALTQIPFYAYEMIRACFSEQDYKKSPHCHDESGSVLLIQFKDIGKPYYQWKLNYTDFTWEAFKPEKDKQMTKNSVIKMPFSK